MTFNATLIVTLTIILNNQGQGKSQLDNTPNNVELSPISFRQFSPLTPEVLIGTCQHVVSSACVWDHPVCQQQHQHLLSGSHLRLRGRVDPSTCWLTPHRLPACLTAPICPWQLPYCPTRPTLHPPSLGEFKTLNIWASITTTLGCLPKNPNDFIFLPWCGPHSPPPSTCPTSTSLKPLLVSLSEKKWWVGAREEGTVGRHNATLFSGGTIIVKEFWYLHSALEILIDEGAWQIWKMCIYWKDPYSLWDYISKLCRLLSEIYW